MDSTSWLSPPYYAAPDPVFVLVPQTGNYSPGRQQTAESAMQDNSKMLLNWPAGFVFGASGSGNRTPNELFTDLLDLANKLTKSPYAGATCVGFDPTISAVTHAALIFATLKRIPAGNWLPGDSRSVYEVWTAPKL